MSLLAPSEALFLGEGEKVLPVEELDQLGVVEDNVAVEHEKARAALGRHGQFALEDGQELVPVYACQGFPVGVV